MNKSRLLSVMGPTLCVLTAVLAHAGFVRLGFEFTHGDYALVPLTADDILKGEFSAFVYNMEYGGTTLQFLRALWVKIWTILSTDGLARIYAHNAFSYVVCPSLLSLASYFVVRAHLGMSAAVFASLVSAVGLDFMVVQFGNDPYIAYLIFGSVLLIWKTKEANPFLGLKIFPLFSAGVLSGQSIYTSRISFLYIAVFFLPWETFRDSVRSLLHSNQNESRFVRLSFYAGSIFLFLWLYLEVFGSDLGVLFGKTVKLHAQPNFYIAISLLTIAVAYSRRAWISNNLKTLSTRTLVLGTGALIGFSPEIVHSLNSGVVSHGGSGGLVAFPEAIRAFGLMPGAFREIVAGTENRLAPTSFLSQGSLIFFTLAFLAFIQQLKRLPSRLTPLIVLTALSAYAFCRIRTYTFANPRYLLPLLPVIWVTLGAYWKNVRIKPTWLVVLAMLPVAAHLVHQINFRAIRLATAHPQFHFKRAQMLIEHFRAAGVHVVVTDDYWWLSNSITWLGQMDPVFESVGPGLRTPLGASRLKSETKIGVVQSSASIESPTTLPVESGKAWRVDREVTVQDLRLSILSAEL